MKKDLIRSGIMAAVLIALIKAMSSVVEYVFTIVLPTKISIIIILIVFLLPIVFAYTVFKNIRDKKFIDKLVYTFSAYLFATTFGLLFNLFLHEFVDKNYKEVYADQVVLKSSKAIEEYEKKHNLKIENDYDEMRNVIIDRFQPENQISSYLKSLWVVVFISIFSAISIFKEN